MKRDKKQAEKDYKKGYYVLVGLLRSTCYVMVELLGYLGVKIPWERISTSVIGRHLRGQYCFVWAKQIM